MYEKIIDSALEKAKLLDNEETSFIAKDVPQDGVVCKIWYRTIGDDNTLVKYEIITLEQWEWEKVGVSNNTEWRRYLNKRFWNSL